MSHTQLAVAGRLRRLGAAERRDRASAETADRAEPQPERRRATAEGAAPAGFSCGFSRVSCTRSGRSGVLYARPICVWCTTSLLLPLTSSLSLHQYTLVYIQLTQPAVHTAP